MSFNDPGRQDDWVSFHQPLVLFLDERIDDIRPVLFERMLRGLHRCCCEQLVQMRGAPANGLSQDADDDDDDDDAGDSECVAQSLQSKLEDETVDRLMGILLAEKTDQLNGDDKKTVRVAERLAGQRRNRRRQIQTRTPIPLRPVTP